MHIHIDVRTTERLHKFEKFDVNAFKTACKNILCHQFMHGLLSISHFLTINSVFVFIKVNDVYRSNRNVKVANGIFVEPLLLSGKSVTLHTDLQRSVLW